MAEVPEPTRALRITAILLAVAYGIGAPAVFVFELREQTFSTRFELPPALIYATCMVQVVCAFALLRRSTASWAAAILTGTTVGATAAHLRIGSPETAITAFVFTVVQIWFSWKMRPR